MVSEENTKPIWKNEWIWIVVALIVTMAILFGYHHFAKNPFDESGQELKRIYDKNRGR
jgi:predicted negative regulator of RcsB-dependent stress response